jgi:hypothetical protein
MKKLLGIVVLGFLLSGNAYADKKFLVCSSDNKVIEKGVKKFLTSINLDDNFLMINNKKFNITSVNDEEIKAVFEIKKKIQNILIALALLFG